MPVTKHFYLSESDAKAVAGNFIVGRFTLVITPHKDGSRVQVFDQYLRGAYALLDAILVYLPAFIESPEFKFRVYDLGPDGVVMDSATGTLQYHVPVWFALPY